MKEGWVDMPSETKSEIETGHARTKIRPSRDGPIGPPPIGPPAMQCSVSRPDRKSLTSTTVNDLPPLLHAVEQCDPQTADKLLPMVYEELRRLATHRMASQPAAHTLQATALVHEAFLRLTGNAANTWADRRHFFAA